MEVYHDNMADLMMNEEIRDREVRVIDQNGEQLRCAADPQGASWPGRRGSIW